MRNGTIPLTAIVSFVMMLSVSACDPNEPNSCADGRSDCEGLCYDLQTEHDHCGACGIACGVEEVCELGACVAQCAAPELSCGDACIDPSIDRDYCGATGDCQGANAGTACDGWQACVGGLCETTVETLETDLEYPEALWLDTDYIYLTESAGKNTAFGGIVRLSRYDRATGELMTLVDNPETPESVVVAQDGTIYLAGYLGAIPGESGSVSSVDPLSFDVSPVTALQIAASDMFMDANEDIYVIGSSDIGIAASLYMLPVDDYANPTVVATGLGRAWGITKVGPDIYYSNLQDGIYHLDGGGTTTQLSQQQGVISLTSDGEHLYFTSLDGDISRMNLQTMEVDTIAMGLASPGSIRYQASSRQLYFVEGGTEVNEYKDGKLSFISGFAGP